jgi:capsular exopolysaccharide synthesis family protein
VAERLANAIMDGYLALHAANANEDAKRVVELLEEEKGRRAEEVRIFQDRVRLLTKSATEDDPALLHGDERVIVQQNPVAGLEQRRLAAEVERAVLEAKLQAAEEAAGDAAGSEVSADEVDAALDANPELQALQRQFATLTAQLGEHRRRSRDPDDSGARRLSSEAQDAAASLEATVAKLRPRLKSELRRRLSSQRRRRMAELKDEIEDQRILERTWQERIDEQRKRIERVGDKSVDLDFARAELERAQDVFQRISDRIVVLQTEMSAPSRAAPLKRAETPSRPIEIVPYKRLAAACLAALCLPFCLAIGWERCTGRIHDGRQLTEEVEFPVLGEISMLPTRWAHAGREDALYLRDRIAFEESIDALRLVLTLSPEIHKADTLAITSAVSREGKSSLASALAASLAKSTRQPILLIDGDMRCPSLHEVFDAPLAPGLAEVLARECSLPEAIVTTTGGTMHFLPAGRLKDSPHAILDCGEFATLLAGLKSTYRYVVIDTPPVLAASEAMIFASAAEATLVCTRRDFSCGPRFRLACKRLSAGGARLAGAVISGLPTRAWSYKYGGNIYGSDRYFDRRRPDVVEEPPPRT